MTEPEQPRTGFSSPLQSDRMTRVMALFAGERRLNPPWQIVIYECTQGLMDPDIPHFTRAQFNIICAKAYWKHTPSSPQNALMAIHHAREAWIYYKNNAIRQQMDNEGINWYYVERRLESLQTQLETMDLELGVSGPSRTGCPWFAD